MKYILLAIFIADCSAQVAENLTSKPPCSSYQSCGACISSPGCAWCSQSDYERRIVRCDVKEKLLNRGCAAENIVNPSNSAEIVEDEELSNAGAVTESAIQIKPQKINLSLRPNQPYKFQVTFRQAEDYPVDLYFLMDLTWSMKKHKDKLAEMADNLADSMFNITKNFQLGFGSFIDKVVMPYADMVPKRLINPCRDTVCSPPYGFRNHLKLNRNVSRFTEEVSRASPSGNLDNAEGGFDAIMQVIACKDKIGWNEQSRKIIIFATDAIFHYAGDGKLGGIVKPNDGLCHLDDDGYYTESIYQDYPSLSQINTKIMETKVNTIFAVPEDEKYVYERLAKHIEGSYVEILAADSSNVVHLIRNQYEKIRSKVELKDNATEAVNVKYFSSCFGEDKKETHLCDGLMMGTTVNFDVEITLTDCPKDPTQWKQTFLISPIGINEYVQVAVDLLCECDCEKPQNEELNSSFCTGYGTYECGICTCGQNHFGRQCECEGDEAVRKDKMAQCKRDNSTELCSGRGECVCDVCECYSRSKEERVYGTYCECDTFSCERDEENRICGGLSRGECCAGECKCSHGWTGAACDCTVSTAACIAPGDEEEGKICSGHGECVCGHCRCTQDARGRYGGPYCEDCSTCEGRCTELRECVQCQIFQTGSYSPEECSNCSFSAVAVEELHEKLHDDRRCIFKDDDDCSFQFLYNYDENNQLIVRVKEEKECPSKEQMLWIALGVTGGVFLVGLVILLVIRLLVFLKDRRDYQKFLDDVSNTQWGTETNPIYKQAVSKYQNPMYDTSNK